MATVLYVTAEVLRAIGIAVQPYIPAAAAKLLDLLAVPELDRGLSAIGEAHRLHPGEVLPQPQPIFPRYMEPEAA
jgi:methionyl-tRNA synthetase